MRDLGQLALCDGRRCGGEVAGIILFVIGVDRRDHKRAVRDSVFLRVTVDHQQLLGREVLRKCQRLVDGGELRKNAVKLRLDAGKTDIRLVDLRLLRRDLPFDCQELVRHVDAGSLSGNIGGL